MALYVSVVLLAALVALEDGATTPDREMLGLIGGRPSARACALLRVPGRQPPRAGHHVPHARRRDRPRPARRRGDRRRALHHPGAAPPRFVEERLRALRLAILLGIAGYAAGRSGGATRLRSLATGGQRAGARRRRCLGEERVSVTDGSDRNACAVHRSVFDICRTAGRAACGVEHSRSTCAVAFVARPARSWGCRSKSA